MIIPPFRVIAIPTNVAESVRATRRAPIYGHPVSEEIATGLGPCRHCLRAFKVGAERRILFTYDPFMQLEALPLPGPVFVHALTCERYPEDAGFPPDLHSHALTFNAYAHGRQLVAQAYATDDTIDETVANLLARYEIAYIHVRNTEAGCYDFRIERASESRPSVT